MKTKVLCYSLLLIVVGSLSAWADVVVLTGSQIQDAMLVQESPNDNFGGRTNFEVGVIGNGAVRTSVMRFDVTDPSLGLFAGGVPQFAQINSITLTLTALDDNVGANPSTGANMDFRVSANQNAQGDWVQGTGTAAASVGDAGTVTYSERQEGNAATAWVPDTNYTRGTGDGVLGIAMDYPGDGNPFSISFNPLPGETLDDLVLRWATGNNEGVLLNDVNRVGFARWIINSSESTDPAVRPQLTIDFTAVPEPASIALWSVLGLFGAAGSVALRRRQRAKR